MSHTAYIALGTNMGDRIENLRLAIKELNESADIEVVNTSSVYETEPVGYEEQEPFLNMVLIVRTSLSPFQLLDVCMKIEQDLGRKRDIRWGPRTIDLDILLYNQENIKSEKLTVPHPRMHERAFVMIPLEEVQENLMLPGIDRPLREIIDNIPDRKGVRIWKQKNGEDVFGLFEN